MVIINIYVGDILSERSQGVSQEFVFYPCGIYNKIAFERGRSNSRSGVSEYHTDNVVIRHIMVYVEYVEEL